MNTSDMFRTAMNICGYAAIAFYLLRMIERLANRAIDKLSEKIDADTKAKIEETAAMSKLSEKIDAWTKRTP